MGNWSTLYTLLYQLQERGWCILSSPPTHCFPSLLFKIRLWCSSFPNPVVPGNNCFLPPTWIKQADFSFTYQINDSKAWWGIETPFLNQQKWRCLDCPAQVVSVALEVGWASTSTWKQRLNETMKNGAHHQSSLQPQPQYRWDPLTYTWHQ
jgi:hypothetical protein